MTCDIRDKIENIKNRTDLARFIDELSQSIDNKSIHWENIDLPSYFEAMSGWISDMDGYYRNIGKACPDRPYWKTIAEILVAASNYE